MTINRLDTLEDRIQKPGYLLFLVVILLLLIVGFVDLIDYVAENPTILGRYTPIYFVVLVGYTLFMVAWASLLLKPNDDHLFIKVLDFIQMRPLLAIGILLVAGVFISGVIIAGNMNVGDMLTLPAFQVTILAITILFSGLVLFYKWGDEKRPQRWRKIVLIGLGILLVIEMILQSLAFLGALPADLSTTTSIDHYSPYSRIYQSKEGFSHGATNNYGRYAPPFELLPDSYRIAVVGDSFVEALQVRKDRNLSSLIKEQLAAEETQDQVREVLSLGYPNLGPGIYLSNAMLRAMVRELEPDEAIIFFDLGSDFQTVDRAGTGYPYFVFKGQGQAEIDSSYHWKDVHEAEHRVARGYQGLQPVLFLKSNYLTPRIVSDILNDVIAPSNSPDREEKSQTNYEIDLPNGFVFDQQMNGDAVRIASAQINMAKEQLSQDGVEIKLVTNPAFTVAFYEQESWNTIFGNSDLLLPERQLRETAGHYGISFLGLGTYMAAKGMTPADVQQLYFDNGLGHLTPAGHEFAAEAIYRCFFAQTVPPEAGCDLR